ncbi:DNA repair protein RecN [Chloroflexota bacterium]
MLLELKVSDFGIIERIDWQPSRGLNVVTGETGTGKSLVIDAIDTLLSGKANENEVRHGADAASIEAVFDLSKLGTASSLHSLLGENNLLEPGESQLVISGIIRRQGRSVFRVNDRAVSRELLQRIGSRLVDIHGQSQHLSLLNRDFHLDFLDAYAHTEELRDRFGDRAVQLAQVEQELKAIDEQEKDRARQTEFLRFQIDELKRADLKEGEEESLEKQRVLHASSEKLKTAAYEAYRTIYGDDTSAGASVLEKLGQAASEVQKLAGLDDSLKAQVEYIREVESGLAEVARDIRNYRDGIDYDPQQLQEIELRLELIRGLKRKYGQTIAEMLDYLARAEQQINDIDTYEERRQQLGEERDSLKKEMGEIASKLSDRRTSAARKLVTEVTGELKELNMSQVKFEVSIIRDELEEGIPLSDGKSYAFTKDGVDIIEFRVSTNPGEPLKPLAAIASTGEVSRFMLALKSALAEADDIPVLIFDEIDIGVGGRSGGVIGRKLWNLARQRQAVCVTHLAQIAVFADSHYSVHKETAGKRTTTNIESIKGDDRIKELAVMLSGPQHTEAAVKNTRELLEKADNWKKGGG